MASRLAAVSLIAAFCIASLLIPSRQASALTVYASDSFNRTAAGGWGNADMGGAWSIAGTPANWSVSPGAGSIALAANGQERAYLGGVAVQDVELAAKLVLPMSTQSNNSIAYLLGRDSGAGGTYYRVGVGQGSGSSTLILRAQRSDGALLSADLDTSIPAADGAVVWFRAQFAGTNPTTIRARAWVDGSTEPTAWPLNVTDANAAEQTATAVGVRVRNEDTVASHTFRVESFSATDLVASPPPPPGPLAADSFSRTGTAAWNNADVGGFWTTVGTPPNWSVAPGAGTIAVAANGDERAYLSALHATDIDVVEQVVLPRSGQANNALAFVLARYVSAYQPTYYAIGIGQGTGSTIILRAQRSDGTLVAPDLSTGIAAANGAVVSLHVQLQGTNSTTIRARAWIDGQSEPTGWMLNVTDSTAAEQVPGAIGVRARNEDTSAAHTFSYRSFQASGTPIPLTPPSPNPSGSARHHYLYVFPDKSMDVFDADDGHRLVKHVSLPTSGVVGAAVSPATGMLYISECGSSCDPSVAGQLVKYDLSTDTIVWISYYSFGVDSMALTPDGRRIYSPDGETSPDGLWHILNADSSAVTGSISANVAGHNTIVSLTGAHAYLGGFQNGANSRYLQVVNTATNAITKQIGPLRDGVRPFTINGAETLAFTTATNFLGFEVSSITTGRVLDTEAISGFTWSTFVSTAPSHGITLSPDEREVYVMDGPNAYVHVFDVSGLPALPPAQVANIQLTTMSGNHTPCASRCEREGWLLHSRDGRFVYVGDSGDVIDTSTRSVIGNLTSLRNTRTYVEVDWQDAVPIFSSTRSGLGYATSTAVGGITQEPDLSSIRSGSRTRHSCDLLLLAAGGIFVISLLIGAGSWLVRRQNLP